VVDALNAAKTTILVQVYSFTSVSIAKALVAVKQRGVNIRLILDKNQRTERYSVETGSPL
jgi:phosphatidylserine/phosphatidylglycerophosphate/cardiolipin synthase-like enzyme